MSLRIANRTVYGSLSLHQQIQYRPVGLGRFWNSTNAKDPKIAVTASTVEESQKQYEALRDANSQMQKYHEARELMKQGKLKNNYMYQANQSSTAIQAGIVIVFLAVFMSMPFLGKRIAQDDEFRNKYIPGWYDFTVKKPDHAWTRDELHEQMLQVQHDIHTRAIAGEFTPEKLQQLQNAMQSPAGPSVEQMNNLYPHRQGVDRSRIPKEWDMVHPGMASDEELDEGDT
jgi:hypothetical protein